MLRSTIWSNSSCFRKNLSSKHIDIMAVNATSKLLGLTATRATALRAASSAAAPKQEEKGAWGLRSEKKKTFAIYR